MNNKATEHNSGASDSARLFCTQISSAASAAGELCTGKRKETKMSKRENEGKKEKKQKKERKEKRKQDGGLLLNPLLTIPRTRARACEWRRAITQNEIDFWREQIFAARSDRRTIKMKTAQLRIKLSEVQHNHFHSLLEQEGCKSVAELFRKIAFTRWPLKGTRKAPTRHP